MGAVPSVPPPERRAQLDTMAGQVNKLTANIAEYNKQITAASASGNTPNSLLDARSEAVRQLNELVGVTVQERDGNYDVYLGSGQSLVTGTKANTLSVEPGVADKSQVALRINYDSFSSDVTSVVSGGAIGGLLRYRQDVLTPSMNELGRVALVVADSINSQLGQGLDLKGQVGAALFGDYNDPATAQLRVRAFSTNTSNVQPALNITDTSILTTSDYRLEFDGTQYSARRLSDGATLTINPNPPATYPAALSFTDSSGRDQGFEIALDSAPAADDRYLLQPTRRGATAITAVLDQPDQLAFAAPVRSDANVQNRGTATIGQPALQSTGSNINPATLQAALPVTLTYDAVAADFTVPAGATLTRINPNDGTPATPATFQSGQQNTYELELSDGSRVRMTLSGRPENGDTFNLSFNQNGVSDNRNALALADLQSKATVGVDPTITGISTGSSFVDSYGDTVERVGTLTAQARQDSLATASILKQATDNRDSLSAVNLDEEAANLIKFEQYYNASAQVIQVARSLFDTLISTFR